MTTAAVAALLLASGCASTQQSATKPTILYTGPDYVPEERRTVEPFAHAMFCTRTPGECTRSGRPAAVALTGDRLNDLLAVNRNVNSQIAPQNDPGDDTWSLSPKSGDCEDYAVTKRHVLIQHGWPASALRLAIGKTKADEGHLVLVVRTSKGDVVLDNLSNDVIPWRDAGLSWRSIQSSTNPRLWYKT